MYNVEETLAYRINCEINTPYAMKMDYRYMYIGRERYTVIHRGYSMLFNEYEIYFTSETRSLIFSPLQSTSENIIKILSHE
jgi:hypothetical protein